MDSPIALAHAHAGNAVLETRRSNPVAASEEHDLAAVEFANAAQNVKNPEARRTLELLEKHHKALGMLLKLRHEQPKSINQEEIARAQEPKSVDEAKNASRQAPLPTSDVPPQPPRLVGNMRPSARDLSSSIASNLASARGIPGGQKRGTTTSPTTSSHIAPGKFVNDEKKQASIPEWVKSTKLREGFATASEGGKVGKPSWVPPNPSDASTEGSPPNEASFQNFYDTLESLVSKISAPLAFAGLPLRAASQTAEPETSKARSSDPTKDLDLSKYISLPALRAAQVGIPSSAPPAESFYVVPTTGGTTSYADMVRPRARNLHSRHPSTLSEDALDDFVDARETPAPKSPNPSKPTTLHHPRPRNMPASEPTINGRSLEELLLENQTQRHAIDSLTQRLHIFEASSQSSTAALHQSIRYLRGSAQLSPETGTTKTRPIPPKDRTRENADADADNELSRTRIQELEALLRRNGEEVARRERENRQLRDTVGKYRDKWDKLKESARQRAEKGNGRKRGEELGDVGENGEGEDET